MVGVDCGPAWAVDAGDEAAEKEQFAVELFRVVGRRWETERIREKGKNKREKDGKKGKEKINGKNKKMKNQMSAAERTIYLVLT